MKLINPFLYTSSIIFFFMSILMIQDELIYTLNFAFLGMINLSFSLVFDFYSFFFLFTVSVITSCVISYSWHYMEGTVYLNRFIMILLSFVLSMMILIISGNPLTAMIGWDGLGFSSLLLIIFFYSNSSYKAGLTTFLCNRVGDVFFILSIIFIFLLSVDPYYSEYSWPYLVSSCVVLTAITKSAQVPFSAWLPAAMAAPTPVSALVHSSTLVTAGIYLLFRFHSLWLNNSFLHYSLCLISIFTLLMASFCALSSWDLKKIIAFSTLSQLGVIMFCLSMNLFKVAFFHLVIHAFIKALLFMAAGVMIHQSIEFQDIRKISMFFLKSPLLCSIFMFSSISLCGIPYLSGFYSKDYLIESFLSSNYSFFTMSFFIIFVLFTSIYLFRLMKILSFNNFMSWSPYSLEMGLYKPMLVMMLFSSFSGATLSWFFTECNFTSKMEKIIPLFLILFFSVASWVFTPKFSSFFMVEIWFLPYIYQSFSISYKSSLSSYLHIELPGFYSWLHYELNKKLRSKLNHWLFISTSMLLEFFFVILVILISI